MNNENALKSALSRGPHCLPVESLGEPLTSSAQVHLNECPHCQTELRLLQEFENGVAREDEARAVAWITAKLAPKPARSAIRRWFTPRLMAGLAAAAAVVILTVGVATQRMARTNTAQPVPEFNNETLRSQTVEIIPSADALRWKPFPGAHDYELSVTDVGGTTIFHNFITQNALAFPADVAKTITVGKLLLWEVNARDAAGNVIARSGTQRLRRQQ